MGILRRSIISLITLTLKRKPAHALVPTRNMRRVDTLRFPINMKLSFFAEIKCITSIAAEVINTSATAIKLETGSLGSLQGGVAGGILVEKTVLFTLLDPLGGVWR